MRQLRNKFFGLPEAGRVLGMACRLSELGLYSVAAAFQELNE
ncbi:hypothetical protein [Rhizobium leguminosarum]|nr:hypothetical protein [Rhizobium leguminosarum]